MTGAVLDTFIEDDADEMIRIIEDELKSLAFDYLLNKKECDSVVEQLSKELTGKALKEMFSETDRKAHAKWMLVRLIEPEVRKREVIHLPTESQMQDSLRAVLEEVANSMGTEDA